MISRREFILVSAIGASAALIGGCAKEAPALAPPAPWWIVGDSIGEGLRWASGAPGDTKRGLPLRAGAPHVLHQIEGAPPGAHIVISLGTNDAIGRQPPEALGVYLDRVVDEAAKTAALITWVGPIKPNAPWAADALHIDSFLALKVPALGARYVSAYHADLGPHAKDGVHYGLGGYRKLWEIVSAR